jgi:hypothetical protein
MDGHSDDSGGRTAPPVGLMEALRSRDPVALALRTLQERETLRPVSVPSVPPQSDKLHGLMAASEPSSVPEELRAEHIRYCEAVDARAGAKAENRRRLRSSLWCEQCLRAASKPEHRTMRAFNMEAWGVQESAPYDFALREAQVEKYA